MNNPRPSARTPIARTVEAGESDPFHAIDWIRYELDYLRREAQAEAEMAYRDWGDGPDRDGYAVYRAAQDRADAAQDDLAAWMAGS